MNESVKAGLRAVISSSSDCAMLASFLKLSVVSGKPQGVAGWTGWVERRE